MIVQPPMKATANNNGRVKPVAFTGAAAAGFAVSVDFAFAKMRPCAGGRRDGTRDTEAGQ